jgi:hypothetical protein
MRDWFGRDQQFEPARHGNLRDFVKACLRGEFGRMPCAQCPRFKLKVADRGERSWSGHCGSRGIGDWVIRGRSGVLRFRRVWRLLCSCRNKSAEQDHEVRRESEDKSH